MKEENEVATLVVESTSPVLHSNFETIKSNLALELQKYELDVNDSNVNEAKKLATKLNKMSKDFDDKRKEIVKIIKEPIDLFEKQVKELTAMCQDGRSKILIQVEEFDKKTRERCKILLIEELEKQYQSFSIEGEYKTISIEDLILISNVNEKSLKKSTIDEVILRVRNVLDLQNKVQRRLLELENICLKAGLTSQLERRHVESFIKELDDNIYQEKLSFIISREAERQKEVEAKLKQEQERLLREQAERIAIEERVKAEMEVKAKVEAERKRLEEQKAKEIEAMKHEVKQEPKIEVQKVAGKDIFIIEAIFSLELSEGAETIKSIQDKFESKLKDSFKSFKAVNVKKN